MSRFCVAAHVMCATCKRARMHTVRALVLLLAQKCVAFPVGAMWRASLHASNHFMRRRTLPYAAHVVLLTNTRTHALFLQLLPGPALMIPAGYFRLAVFNEIFFDAIASRTADAFRQQFSANVTVCLTLLSLKE